MSDLVTELQKESFKVDADNERKICAVRCCCLPPRLPIALTRLRPPPQTVLKQLEDVSPEVQGMAVKWCAP